MYEPDKMQKFEIIQTIVAGKVTSIQSGPIRNFVKDLTKWECPETAEVIQVHVMGEHNGLTIESATIIMLPTDKIIRPRSTLAKWQSGYGKLPEIGQDVQMKMNADGYWKVVM